VAGWRGHNAHIPINPLTVTERFADAAQKVPTVLSYCKAKIQWGYQVQGVPEAIRGIKLLLDDSQKYRYGPTKTSEEAIRGMRKTVVQVSGDFLSVLVDHAREVLDRRFGTALHTMEADYIVTVPAVWSNKATDATLSALEPTSRNVRLHHSNKAGSPKQRILSSSSTVHT
jgi:hypothetical protein